MLIEKFPDVRSLPLEQKWVLFDELWQELAQRIENSPADAGVVDLLEKRFSDYLSDPTLARSPEEVTERLAAQKRTWK